MDAKSTTPAVVNGRRRFHSCLQTFMIKLVVVTILISNLIGHSNLQGIKLSMRSVRKCDSESSISGTFASADGCENHCQQVYIRRDIDLIDANKNLAYSQLITDAGSSTAGGRRLCCCVFNAKWPEWVKPKLLGQRSELRQKMHAKAGECLPKVVSVFISERTSNSYDEVCHYMRLRRHLNMLEMLRFARSASYLNMMQPRQPSIMVTMRNKRVKAIKLEQLHQLENHLKAGELLDDLRPFEAYEGHRLGVEKFNNYAKLSSQLRPLLRSFVFVGAYEELVLGHMAVDFAAAYQTIDFVNKNYLHIPDHLLTGHYDKYDTQDRAAYFTVPTIDCKLLADISNKLQIYLSAAKNLSASLTQKLWYENFARYDSHVIELEHSKKIYTHLLGVNCGRQNRKASKS